jgi:hypothetical protein
MTREATPGIVAVQDGDGSDARDFLIIRWPGNVRALWSDVYDVELADYPGITFIRAGGFVNISEVVQNLSNQVQSFRVGFNPLDNGVVTQLTGFPLHQIKVTWGRAIFHPTTRAFDGSFELFRGRVDRPDESIEGEEVSLTYHMVSSAREMDRSTLRTRSDNDQLRVSGTDRFYQFSAKAGDRFDWGRASQSGRSSATL